MIQKKSLFEYNTISGTVPTELGLLSSLTVMFVQYISNISLERIAQHGELMYNNNITNFYFQIKIHQKYAG